MVTYYDLEKENIKKEMNYYFCISLIIYVGLMIYLFA
jgi:hypothetical protein